MNAYYSEELQDYVYYESHGELKETITYLESEEEDIGDYNYWFGDGMMS